MHLTWNRMAIASVALVAVSATSALADVKTQERTQVKFEGMLGRMAGLFGGKAVKEGVVSTVAIKGDRKMTTSGETGEIVDLTEEKVYRLDLDKKSYTVVTFDELRKQMQEAQRRARESAGGDKKEPQGKPEEPQVDVDFDLKETGQKRTISGYDTREVLMTVTVREKGKTLEQAGGLLLTSSSWLAPEIPGMKEQADFEMRYARKLYGDLVSVEAMQAMTAAVAMYPGMKQAMERMSKEKVNMTGTPLLTTMSFQAVKNPQQAQQEERESASGGGGGLGGLLARKIMKKKEDSPEQASGRATIMTSTTEVLKIATDVSPAEVAIPAGFKQR
jgi:hypothetical protein